MGLIAALCTTLGLLSFKTNYVRRSKNIFIFRTSYWEHTTRECEETLQNSGVMCPSEKFDVLYTVGSCSEFQSSEQNKTKLAKNDV